MEILESALDSYKFFQKKKIIIKTVTKELKELDKATKNNISKRGKVHKWFRNSVSSPQSKENEHENRLDKLKKINEDNDMEVLDSIRKPKRIKFLPKVEINFFTYSSLPS